jgi:hypothetical protein
MAGDGICGRGGGQIGGSNSPLRSRLQLGGGAAEVEPLRGRAEAERAAVDQLGSDAAGEARLLRQ